MTIQLECSRNQGTIGYLTTKPVKLFMTIASLFSLPRYLVMSKGGLESISKHNSTRWPTNHPLPMRVESSLLPPTLPEIEKIYRANYNSSLLTNLAKLRVELSAIEQFTRSHLLDINQSHRETVP